METEGSLQELLKKKWCWNHFACADLYVCVTLNNSADSSLGLLKLTWSLKHLVWH